MNKLKLLFRQCIVLSSIILIAGFALAKGQGKKSVISESYSCIPCGQNCDKGGSCVLKQL
jgi:hypothetical protein